jgi:uncharacterized membrane protein YphA (DoxX/SURF4 family)
MTTSQRKAPFIAYIVVAILMALTMGISASGKFMQIPGAVHTIHEVVGVPLSLFPLLAALEIAGGIGLVVGIFRPKIGVAAGIGLVLYFTSAMAAHAIVRDFAGLKAPIVPFVLSIAALTLRVRSLRRQ